MRPKNDIVLYVQPVSSVEYVVKHIKASNLKCVAIFIEYSEKIKTSKNYFMGYDDVITAPEDPELIVGLVRDVYPKDRVLFVLPRTDEILPYVEKLAEHYCRELMNSSLANTMRTHKDKMNQFLHKHNIPAVQQVIIDENNISSLQQVIKDFNFPLFVNPCTGHVAYGG